MIYLILAIVGLTLLGLTRIAKTGWAIAEAIYNGYKKATTKELAYYSYKKTNNK